ncbi:MAG: AraC family transcriptional regulator [Clostridiales bacterium]|jgi:AraC family transcriptional regulator|nr:AraC family transcriptional regulator [Clostridiales bacterium]
MNQVEVLNNLVDYIEEHLDSDIEIHKIEQLTACPYRIFQRMFSFIVGVPLMEYIRRRRLSESAYELLVLDNKVIDIALKYGYESADAFTVAFKKQHGISPFYAKQQNVELISYPRLSFTLEIKGGVAMNYRIVEKNEMNALGVFGSVENDIWGKVKGDGTLAELQKISGNESSLGLCFGYDDKGNNTYMVAVETDQSGYKDYKTYIVPSTSWIVFESRGAVIPTLGETWKRIYSEFMPSSNYKQDPDIPTIEKYFSNNSMANDYLVEIWLPILNK